MWVTTPLLSSFVYLLSASKSAKSREILRKFELIVVQGHHRSLILVSIESAHVRATSYWSVVTMDVSLTVFEILTHLARKSLFFHPTLACRPLAEERLAIST